MQTMTGASAVAPTREKMTRLFSQIDSAQSGSITQGQFNSAFQSMSPPASFKALGSGAVFSALDPDGTGSVSKSDFINTMSALSNQLRSAPADAAPAPGSRGGSIISTTA
jgi:Ca2+-binding EF-hand superfamily protein